MLSQLLKMTEYKPRGLEDCNDRYGSLSFSTELGLHWPEAPKWITAWKVPDGVTLKLQNGQPVYRIFCNKDLQPALSKAFQDLIWTGAFAELKSFDGCFNVRWVRGVPGVASYHSWGLALDFNASTNQLGSLGSLSETFVKCFTMHGFAWGGNFKSRKDPMHFQWVELPISKVKTS